MIRTGDTQFRKNFSTKRPKASFHSVANNSAADLFGDCNAEPLRFVAIFAVTNLQDKAGHGRALAAIGSEKIASFADCFQTGRKRRG